MSRIIDTSESWATWFEGLSGRQAGKLADAMLDARIAGRFSQVIEDGVGLGVNVYRLGKPSDHKEPQEGDVRADFGPALPEGVAVDPFHAYTYLRHCLASDKAGVERSEFVYLGSFEDEEFEE